MSWALRPARPSDAAAMAGIHAGLAGPGWSAADFSGWLSRAEGFGALAEGQSGPAAFALGLAAGEDAELLMIATASQNQRSGAGRAVLAALADEARRRGLARLVLEVAQNNASALGLYRSEGFVEIGRRPRYYQQEGAMQDALVLALDLGALDLGR